MIKSLIPFISSAKSNNLVPIPCFLYFLEKNNMFLINEEESDWYDDTDNIETEINETVNENFL